jgi:hypothetical protein
MNRFLLALLGTCSAWVLVGCAGSLDNPEDFVDTGIEVKDAEMILAESCGTVGCHSDGAQPAAGLDLLSPGVEARVVDVDATGVTCGNDVLVVAGDPDGSHMLDKVLGICGLQMPPVTPLPPDEVEVLRDWIDDLGSSSGGTPDGG